ncbi:uncharacterized protein O3Q21_005956 [Podargus strigoides]
MQEINTEKSVRSASAVGLGVRLALLLLLCRGHSCAGAQELLCDSQWFWRAAGALPCSLEPFTPHRTPIKEKEAASNPGKSSLVAREATKHGRRMLLENTGSVLIGSFRFDLESHKIFALFLRPFPMFPAVV